jgi:dUTP pyrophosphatase
MQVKVKFHSAFELPKYETSLSAGMDIRANMETSVELKPMERRLFPTGLYMEIPDGYECQVRPRSGLALKKGITVLNSPGTIDADYRGEIGVILVNLGKEDFVIQPGERVAQAVLAKYERISWEETQQLSETTRGDGGFGSTGGR